MHINIFNLFIYLQVIDWPFRSMHNTLDVEMENVVHITNLPECDDATPAAYKNEEGGSLRWVKVSIFGVSTYLFKNNLYFILIWKIYFILYMII